MYINDMTPPAHENLYRWIKYIYGDRQHFIGQKHEKRLVPNIQKHFSSSGYNHRISKNTSHTYMPLYLQRPDDKGTVSIIHTLTETDDPYKWTPVGDVR